MSWHLEEHQLDTIVVSCGIVALLGAYDAITPGHAETVARVSAAPSNRLWQCVAVAALPYILSYETLALASTVCHLHSKDYFLARTMYPYGKCATGRLSRSVQRQAANHQESHGLSLHYSLQMAVDMHDHCQPLLKPVDSSSREELSCF